jgi:hypothetical protein
MKIRLQAGFVGGLTGTVHSCCFAGVVEGAADAGERVGASIGGGFDLIRTGAINDSFWDIETNGQTIGTAGTGKTTSQMKQKATFAGWGFIQVWDIAESQTYPFLRAKKVDHE